MELKANQSQEQKKAQRQAPNLSDQQSIDRGVRLGRGPGAYFEPHVGTHFEVWAPHVRSVDLKIISATGATKTIAMQSSSDGLYCLTSEEAQPGTRYKFVLDHASEYPDPASRFQPEGVHGPSEVVDSEYAWTDSAWRGVAVTDLVFYELHIGTFTAEGTLDSALARIPHLKKLGVTAIELMPVAQFPGARNWGYDGVYPFAVQNSYGGPTALKRFVNACHHEGIGVYLDVVYNHLGPEGNYLGVFGDYFLKRYQTPWGSALNFDGGGSDQVRRYFLSNARQWLEEFHFDGLRLDAIHAICDLSAKPFLEELANLKDELEARPQRKLQLVAETDANDSRILKRDQDAGDNGSRISVGIDAQWNDDFHHALHALLTGESQGYYQDFGQIQQLAKVYAQGVAYDGQWSEYRHCTHGRSYSGVARKRLVVYAQNHDQIGNRATGDRLSAQLSFEQLKLAAASVCISPFAPLLFMGEEWGDTSPFCYFVDHQDPELIEAVRRGRAEEFRAFSWQGVPPDPADANTFAKSRILSERNAAKDPMCSLFFRYYQQLIRLSKWIRKHELLEENRIVVRLTKSQKAIVLTSKDEDFSLRCWFSFQDKEEMLNLEEENKNSQILLDSSLFTLENQNKVSDKKIGPTLLLKPWSAVVVAQRKDLAT